MSGKDRFGTQASYWIVRAKQAASAASAKVDERTGAVSAARRAAGRVASRRDRFVERSSTTRTGRAAGKAMRSLASVAARMPLTGLTTDAMSARHGLAPLTEHLKEHPDDPMAGALLLDAMSSAEADRRRYRAVRTAIDPTSWVTRSVTSTVGEMGREEGIAGMPFAERLARSVYSLAVADLREDPTDGRAWHALARVHLARGDANGARQFAKVAVLSDPEERAVALVTLARAELLAGLLPEAERVAALAIAAGQTCGWQVRNDVHESAALHDVQADARRARLDEAAGWLSMIDDEDRIEYFGVHVDGAGMLRGVVSAQRRKTASLASSARSVAAKVGDGRPSSGAAPLPPPAPSMPPPTASPPMATPSITPTVTPVAPGDFPMPEPGGSV